MKLITAHRILIGAAITFFLFYAARMLWSFGAGGGTAFLVQAVVSLAVAIGLVIYYRTLSGWGRRS